MHPRYYEGVVYLHPEGNWRLPPSQRPLILLDEGAGAYVSHWGFDGEPPTDAEIETALAEKDGAADAEVMRVATFADDPEVTDGLTQIKGGTAQDIDAHVEQTIALTATDLEGLKAEVQAVLRAIYRRQLKVQFNPKHLLDQLDQATAARARIKK